MAFKDLNPPEGECDCQYDHNSLEYIATAVVAAFENRRSQTGQTYTTTDVGANVARIAKDVGWIRSQRVELLEAYVADLDSMQSLKVMDVEPEIGEPKDPRESYNFNLIQDTVYEDPEDN